MPSGFDEKNGTRRGQWAQTKINDSFLLHRLEVNVIAIITDELDPGLHNHDRDNPLIDRRDHEFCI